MKKLRNHVAASVGFVLFVGVIAFSIPQTGYSTSANQNQGAVNVVNTENRFTSNDAYYASVSSPAESLSFEWDDVTGIPTSLIWVNEGNVWFLHSDPGSITPEVPGSNYYEVNLRITTAGYEDTAYPLKGKLTIDVERPSGATFAAIFEGTSTSWLVADGTLIRE